MTRQWDPAKGWVDSIDTPTWNEAYQDNATVDIGKPIFQPNIIGGSINIGQGSSSLRIGAEGIYLGADTFASSPFSVTMSGGLTASSATITGTITATAGKIANWTINTNSLSSGNMTIDSVTGIDFNSVFTVDESGVLTATSGTVGGWTLGATTLTGGDAILDSSGILSLGTGTDIISIDAADATYRLAIGHSTYASAPFRVTKAGALVATSATITGTITATAGYLGGWQVTSDTIQDVAGTVGLSSAVTGGNDIRIWAGNVTPGSADFWVKEDGSMQANAGTIGGNTLSSTYIESVGYTGGALGTGWRIENTGDATFQNIRARGKITTSVFEKDTLSSVGGYLLIARSDILDADMTAADSSNVTITGDATFEINEIIWMKDGTDEEYMQVIDVSSAPTYGVIRDLAAAYAADSNPIWTKGTAVVSTGVGGYSYSQSFDGLTIGNLDTQDSWTDSSDVGYEVQVTDLANSQTSNLIAYNGDQWIEFYNADAVSKTSFVSRNITNYTSGVIIFSLMDRSGGTDPTFTFTVNGQGGTSFSVTMNSAAGFTLVGTTNESITAIGDIPLNMSVWYKIYIEFDASLGTYGRVRAKQDNSSWSSWVEISAGTSFTSISSINMSVTAIDYEFLIDAMDSGSYPNSGFFEMFATGNNNAPYIRVLARNSITYNDYTSKLVIGNLNVITGNAEYGITAEGQEFKLSNTGLDLLESSYAYESSKNSAGWVAWKTNNFTEDSAVVGVGTTSTTRTFISQVQKEAGSSHPGTVTGFWGVTEADIGNRSGGDARGLWWVTQTGSGDNLSVEARLESISSGTGTAILYLTAADGITITGAVTAAGGITADIIGNLTGQADTVATITGLAPDTATTQAVQANITTAVNLVSVGALDSGSITANFGTIDNGASTITTTGVITGGGLYVGGSNKELRFYEGVNYVGFEAPSLSANQIWVLPDADGTVGQAMITDGAGGLSFGDVASSGGGPEYSLLLMGG